jgi:hypothetical protein
VAADPHLFNDVTDQLADRPVVIAYTDGEAIAFATLEPISKSAKAAAE